MAKEFRPMSGMGLLKYCFVSQVVLGYWQSNPKLLNRNGMYGEWVELILQLSDAVGDQVLSASASLSMVRVSS